MLTIKDVADACGMPQPVIAQLVPRQWVEGAGWMYTQKDLEYAVELADRLAKSTKAADPCKTARRESPASG
jgi:hypothetical protein